MKTNIITICILILISGCTYNVNTRSPNVKLQLIDKDTLRPVHGANIYCMERPNIISVTDLSGNGRIFRQRESIRYFPFGPWNVTPPDCTLTIKAYGYQDVVFEKVKSLDIDKGIFYIKSK